MPPDDPPADEPVGAPTDAPTDAPAPPDPLILTLRLDADTEARLRLARERWFPPRLNRIPAHLTLFHKLPGEELERVLAECRAVAADVAPFPARVGELVSLGAGWAVRVRAGRLDAVRARLAGAFRPWLTPQDAQGFRAHVTVQNKVGRAIAVECEAAIRAELDSPRDAIATGIGVWIYRGGPWEALETVAFGDV